METTEVRSNKLKNNVKILRESEDKKESKSERDNPDQTILPPDQEIVQKLREKETIIEELSEKWLRRTLSSEGKGNDILELRNELQLQSEEIENLLRSNSESSLKIEKVQKDLKKLIKEKEILLRKNEGISMQQEERRRPK